jgi:hypothetical protein
MAKQILEPVVLVIIVVHIVLDITPDLEHLVVAHQPVHKVITLLLKMEEPFLG